MAAHTTTTGHHHRSAIQCFGTDSSRCGYCSQQNSSRSYGLWAYRLDVRDYQNMLDAGWRRSGSYLYRPDMSTTCCPTYVVRLEAARFMPSSTHKRVLKRFRRYAATTTANAAAAAAAARHHHEQHHPQEQQTTPDSTVASVVAAQQPLSRQSNTDSNESTPASSVHAFSPQPGPTYGVTGGSSAQQHSGRNPITKKGKQQQQHHHHHHGHLDKTKLEADRVRLMNIIRSVITECARRREFGPDLNVEQVDDSARKSVKVFPPRRPISYNGKQYDPKCNAVWCTNAAMTLAATERSLSAQNSTTTTSSSSTTVPLKSSKTPPLPSHSSSTDTGRKGKAKQERRKKQSDQKLQYRRGSDRQLEIAKTIESYLQKAVSSDYSVSVTEPGFLNLFPRISNDDNNDDDGNDDNDNDDQAVDMDTDTNVCPDMTGVDAKAMEDTVVRRPHQRRIGRIPLLDDDNSLMGSPPPEQMTDDSSGVVMDHDSINNVDDINNNNSDQSLLDIDDDIDNDLTSDFNSEPIQQQSAYFGAINTLTRDGLFSMELVPSKFRADAYEIFRRYQMAIHKESEYECRREAYLKFLVESPLVKERVTASSADDVWYGSFHIQYKLDGQLFAVGVVDVLPKCLSSVYLFYDPAFGRLSPGILSALKEIEWVQQVHTLKYFPSLQFYYMGYYIHTCPKMRYKISFSPSELLCDETKNWISTENAKRVLDNNNSPSTKLPRRLAPQGMRPAPEAANFDLTDDELDRLTNECRIELNINSPDGRDRRRMSLYTLARTVHSSYLDRVQNLRDLLRRFVQLVGRSSTKFFIHLT